MLSDITALRTVIRYYLTVITVIMGVNIVVFMHCWDYVVIRGGSRNEGKGGTLLLAGDSMESGGVLSQESFGPLRWILRRYDYKVICLPRAAPAS